MTRFTIRLFGCLVFIILTALGTKNASAGSITATPLNDAGDTIAVTLDENVAKLRLTISGITAGDYDIRVGGPILGTYHTNSNQLELIVCGDGDYFKTDCDENDYFHSQDYDVKVWKAGTTFNVASKKITIAPYVPNIYLNASENPTSSTIMAVNVDGHRRPTNLAKRNTYDINLFGISGTGDPPDPEDFVVGEVGIGEKEFGPLPEGSYQLDIFYDQEMDFALASFQIIVDDNGGGSIGDIDTGTKGGLGAGGNPCTAAGCQTALGNIPITIKDLSENLLSIGIGAAGGLALILIVVGAIRILVSQGDQQKLNGGREMIVAAVAGLLFLIFATIILQFIGISILSGVPGIG